MTVGAAAIEPISAASTIVSALTPNFTRRRPKNTYRTLRRMSLGTIWISIMKDDPRATRVKQYNTLGAQGLVQGGAWAQEARRARGRKSRSGKSPALLSPYPPSHPP